MIQMNFIFLSILLVQFSKVILFYVYVIGVVLLYTLMCKSGGERFGLYFKCRDERWDNQMQRTKQRNIDVT